MSDVGKVSGDKNRPEPKGPKKKKGTDSEAFKEMMKVGKVREADPEEKRERKSQAESEEELKSQQTATPPHQGLGAEGPQQPPPFQGSPGTQLPIQSSDQSSAPSMGPDVTPADEYYPEEFLQQPVQQSIQQPGQQTGQTQQNKARRKQAPDPDQKTTEPKAAVKGTKKTPSAPPLTAQEKKAVEKTLKDKDYPPLPEALPAAPQTNKKQKLIKEKEAPEEVVPPAHKAPPLASGAWEAGKESSKDDREEKKGDKVDAKLPSDQSIAMQQPATGTPSPTTAPTAPMAPLVAPFANLPAPIQKVFERMVGVMSVMTTQGVQETTINLSNPQFANSVFYGTQVIITEFSTAPKAFNIEILGNQQAVSLMQANAEELVAAFQAGNYTFKVNRIDTGYLPSSKEVRRKETSKVKRKKTGEG